MFILFIVLLVILLVGVPLGLTFLFYKVLKKRGYNKWVQTLALIPTLLVGYFIYDFIYPSDSFYKQDFEEVTGMRFPKDAVILQKSSSLPDHFGDYSSKFYVQVDPSLYSALPSKLAERGFVLDTQYDYSKWIDDFYEDYQIKIAYSYEEAGGVYYFVGFIHNSNLLYLRRSSY